MNKKQFFLGIFLASLIGGVIALAGASYLTRQNSASNFTDKQNTSLVNMLSDDKFTVPDGINFVASAAAVTPAVVHVKSSVTISQSERGSDPFEEFFGFRNPERDMQPREGMSSGSGVIISEDGYIVTNNHVIQDANDIEVRLKDGRTFKAKKLGADPESDIALLQIEAKKLVQIPLDDFSADSFERNFSAAVKRFASGYRKTVAFVAPAANPYGGGVSFNQLQQGRMSQFSLWRYRIKTFCHPVDHPDF